MRAAPVKCASCVVATPDILYVEATLDYLGWIKWFAGLTKAPPTVLTNNDILQRNLTNACDVEEPGLLLTAAR
jgi:hypothetical protein